MSHPHKQTKIHYRIAKQTFQQGVPPKTHKHFFFPFCHKHTHKPKCITELPNKPLNKVSPPKRKKDEKRRGSSYVAWHFYGVFFGLQRCAWNWHSLGFNADSQHKHYPHILKPMNAASEVSISFGVQCVQVFTSLTKQTCTQLTDYRLVTLIYQC